MKITATEADVSDLIKILEGHTEGSATIDALICNTLYGGEKRPPTDIAYTWPYVGVRAGVDLAPVSRHLEAAKTLLPEECVYAIYTTFSGKARAEIYRARIGKIAKQDDHIAGTDAMALCLACLTAHKNMLIIKGKIERGEMSAEGL